MTKLLFARGLFGFVPVLLIAAFFLATHVKADCFYEESSLQDQLQLTPIVVRVQFDSTLPQAELPCSIEIYQDSQGYVLEDAGFTQYKIVEVFQQEWSDFLEDNSTTTIILQPDDTIAIVHDTDTGFYPALPSYLTSDSDGFLVFLYPYRVCLEGDEALEVTNYEKGAYLKGNPFLLNECATANQAWSSVSEEDPELLRSLAGYIPEAGGNIPTNEPNGNNNINTTLVPSDWSVNATTNADDDAGLLEGIVSDIEVIDADETSPSSTDVEKSNDATPTQEKLAEDIPVVVSSAHTSHWIQDCLPTIIFLSGLLILY